MKTDKMWVEFINHVITGMDDSSDHAYRRLFGLIDREFDEVVFGGHIWFEKGGKFGCNNDNYLINPRWDLVNEQTWKWLIFIDEKFAVMRLLYV